MGTEEKYSRHGIKGSRVSHPADLHFGPLCASAAERRSTYLSFCERHQQSRMISLLSLSLSLSLSLCLRLFPVLMQHLFIAGPESELGKRAALPAFVSYGRPRPAAAASWRKYIFRKSDCDTPTARRRSWSAKKEGGGVKEGLDSVGITEPLLHAKWFQMKNKGKEERERERGRFDSRSSGRRGSRM